MSVMATRWPCRANLTAVAVPMPPPAAPVRRTTGEPDMLQARDVEETSGRGIGERVVSMEVKRCWTAYRLSYHGFECREVEATRIISL